MFRSSALRLVPAALLALSMPALAHTGHGHGAGAGMIAGLTHPLLGWDHLAAMLALGLWGAVLGRPAVWLLPVFFATVIGLAGSAAALGAALPGIEIGIAASAIVLGLLVIFMVRPPIWIAAAIVGVFAVFHGQAHGVGLVDAAIPTAYAVGFVLSTGLLYATGLVLGRLLTEPRGRLRSATGHG